MKERNEGRKEVGKIRRKEGRKLRRNEEMRRIEIN